MNYNVILTLITDFFNALTNSLLGFLIINNFIFKLLGVMTRSLLFYAI